MGHDLVKILEAHKDDELFGPIVDEVLQIIKDSNKKCWNSPGNAQSSLSIAKIYKIRMSLNVYNREHFSGMEQSIVSLSSKDVGVRLSVFEADKCIISVWLVDDKATLVGIVIGKMAVVDYG